MSYIQSKRSATLPTEPHVLTLLKAVLYLFAVAAYLFFFTSPWAMWTSLICAGASLVIVAILERSLSLRGVLVFTVIPILFALVVSGVFEGSELICSVLGVASTLRIAESTFFGGLTFGIIFGLRSWGRRQRLGTWVEGGVVCLSVVQLFATHRGGQLHEPRFFADWVIISGEQSVLWWLILFGVLLSGVALVMFSRVRSVLNLVSAACLIALMLGGFYLFTELGYQARKVEPLTLGGGKGKGGGNEGGKGEDGDGSGGGAPPNRPPVPVAVAVFHDDYAPEHGILYFRQQTLSYFDGVKLVSDSSGRHDQDVLTRFPNETALLAAPTQTEENHIKISTSMYLIDQHPTPPALTHAKSIAPLDNPAPQRFIAAYSVTSMAPAVQLGRYVGRGSIPSSWSDEESAHYLSTHDEDPRYRTLSDEIVRTLPPHRSSNPIDRAIAIKKFLEKEGYYTLRVKHRSSRDPAASFLFGDLRGYCVHFAHSAVHLLRSQGIAARVALGYAVDARTRSNSSAVLITGDRAHAWPEIHIDGVGWVTFDIYPEESDEPPPSSVSQSLESLFGEVARKQTGRGVKRGAPFPWRRLGQGFALLMLSLMVIGYLITLWRLLRVRWAPAEQRGRLAYLVAVERLAAAGLSRRLGESREDYARRLEDYAPGLITLTNTHLSWALGAPDRREQRGQLVTEESVSMRRAFARQSRARWCVALLNPFGWILSR